MIIFGTRGITTTPENGNFHCPTCNCAQHYRLRRVRRVFTLYFIPLIPLDKLGEYVECDACKDTYKPEVLSYDPNAGAMVIEAEYHTAIKKVMLHVLLADGVVDESEVETAQSIYQRVTGSQVDKEQLRAEIDEVRKSEEALSGCLRSLQGALNDSGKEMVIKAAFYVAMADGEFQEDEQRLVLQIGSDLGMTSAHVQGVVSSA